MTPEELFGALVGAQPSRPFVTYYDESSGERTELSVKSLANWVAKTHHLLSTELGLGVGDTAVVALPAHWISVPILLGCLTAGLTVQPTAAPAPAEVAFVSPARAEAGVGADETYAVAPEHAAVGWRDTPPAGTSDYVSAVRPQADAWGTVRFGATADDRFSGGLTRGEAVVRARARAEQWGWRPGARILTTRDWSDADDWIDTLLAPLAVGGSVVYVSHCTDAAVLARRRDQERCTDQL